MYTLWVLRIGIPPKTVQSDPWGTRSQPGGRVSICFYCVSLRSQLNTLIFPVHFQKDSDVQLQEVTSRNFSDLGNTLGHSFLVCGHLSQAVHSRSHFLKRQLQIDLGPQGTGSWVFTEKHECMAYLQECLYDWSNACHKDPQEKYLEHGEVQRRLMSKANSLQRNEPVCAGGEAGGGKRLKCQISLDLSLIRSCWPASKESRDNWPLSEG